MSPINTERFDTALPPQDQLDEALAERSDDGDRFAASGQAASDRESPQELADDTFVDLTAASQKQIGEEIFFDEDTPETIDTQEMVSTLVNSVSASVTEAEAAALLQVSPGTALSLLEP